MKVVEDLQKSVDSLLANFQTFTQDIKRVLARPPVNKIDSAEIAAAVKPIFDKEDRRVPVAYNQLDEYKRQELEPLKTQKQGLEEANVWLQANKDHLEKENKEFEQKQSRGIRR